MINLKIRTNADAYRVLLKMNVPWVGQHNVEGLIVSQFKGWQ